MSRMGVTKLTKPTAKMIGKCLIRLLWGPSSRLRHGDDLNPRRAFAIGITSTRYHRQSEPLFEAMGECTNVYVNSIEEAALKKGRPYPDKTMFFVDLHEFTVSEGSYVEGPRKPTAIMLKDNRETRNDKSEFISNKDRGDTTDSALAHVLASHI
jgi:hypothetical protein